MSFKLKYGGVIVPMVSPLDPEGNADTESVAQLVEHLVAEGAKPFVLGTTGEAPSLPSVTRLEIVKAASATINNRTLLYAGISNNCFEDSLIDAERFYKLGANVLVSTPPAYYSLNDSSLIKYFEDLADKLPLPLMLYNMPSTTKISIPISVINVLSQHPNIIGIKDSEQDEERVLKIIEMYKKRNDFVFLSGWAASSYKTLGAGAEGIVPSAGNLIPSWYVELFTAVKTGNKGKAESLQKQTDKVSLLYQKGKSLAESLAALKLLLSLKGLCDPYVAPPLYTMDEQEEKKYLREMKIELKKMKIL